MIKQICMLSTHGYFDPIPELGKTDTGGQVIFILQVADTLAKQGIKVDIYTRWFDKQKKQIDPHPDNPDVRVIRIPAGPWEFIPKEKIYKELDELANNMVKFIKQNGLQYDLFHGHYVDAGIVALKISEIFNKPVFFTAHSLGAWKKQRLGGNPDKMDKIFNFTKRIREELRIFKSVDAQTITSFEEKEKLKELYNFIPPHIEFIPPGVNIHQFRPLREREPEEKTRIKLPKDYIFMVSRIAKPKGHHLIIPAFAKVLKKFPDNHLVIGGGTPNPDQEEIEVINKTQQMIKEYNLYEKVHLVGGIHHEELPPYFRKARQFILPAGYEPFGMTALEAMACRVPAIITQYSGIQQNLKNNKDCLIVDPFDTEGFANAIITLLKDRQLAAKLSQAGYEMVVKKFSWEAIAKQFISFYKKYI